ncbi:hypothetical protein HanRHA438_Chr07g0292081 [Helianthus annuus]|nr:hypothetical protein HanRHA438_Chr07g0292081 [Helianthus annuus]
MEELKVSCIGISRYSRKKQKKWIVLEPCGLQGISNTVCQGPRVLVIIKDALRTSRQYQQGPQGVRILEKKIFITLTGIKVGYLTNQTIESSSWTNLGVLGADLKSRKVWIQVLSVSGPIILCLFVLFALETCFHLFQIRVCFVYEYYELLNVIN